MSKSDNEMSLKDFFIAVKSVTKRVFSNWKIILVFVIAGICLGYAYAKHKKKLYIADTTFVLDEGDKSNGLLGQYSGLASLAGLDVAGGANGIFQGDNILELYKSHNMVKRALLSSPEKGESKKFIDYYLDMNKIRNKWESPKLKSLVFNDTASDKRLQDSILDNVIEDIQKNYLNVSRPNKKLSIIQVEVKSANEIFSKTFNNQVVKTVNDFYIETKTHKSLQNLAILQKQTDSVRTMLNGAIYQNASINDATPNLNPTRQILRVPAQHSQVNIEADKAILIQLVQNLELAKITLRKETPLIQILDEPTYPLAIKKLSTVVAMALGGMLFGFISILFFTASIVLKKVIS